MDDLNYLRMMRESEKWPTLTVQIFSNYIRMEFGTKICGILATKRGKVTSTKRIELPSADAIKVIGKGGYKYLGILEFDSVRGNYMIRNFYREHSRRSRLVMRCKLDG